MRVEYRVIRIQGPHFGREAALNEMGAEGWSVVTVLDGDVFYFQRTQPAAVIGGAAPHVIATDPALHIGARAQRHNRNKNA
jgi:hypothetical protein